MSQISHKCPACGSNNTLLIQYPFEHPAHYDGVSEIDCRDCGARYGRWSGKILNDGEFEKPYGKEC